MRTTAHKFSLSADSFRTAVTSHLAEHQKPQHSPLMKAHREEATRMHTPRTGRKRVQGSPRGAEPLASGPHMAKVHSPRVSTATTTTTAPAPIPIPFMRTRPTLRLVSPREQRINSHRSPSRAESPRKGCEVRVREAYSYQSNYAIPEAERTRTKGLPCASLEHSLRLSARADDDPLSECGSRRYALSESPSVQAGDEDFFGTREASVRCRLLSIGHAEAEAAEVEALRARAAVLRAEVHELTQTKAVLEEAVGELLQDLDGASAEVAEAEARMAQKNAQREKVLRVLETEWAYERNAVLNRVALVEENAKNSGGCKGSSQLGESRSLRMRYM